MFYDEFIKLCTSKGVSKQRACIDCGISRTAWNKWKNGGVPNGATISRLAEYFGVTSDFLLGGEETEKAPTPEGERQIGFDDFTYAMHNEAKDLPQEKKDMLLQMARFMKAEMEKDGQ